MTKGVVNCELCEKPQYENMLQYCKLNDLNLCEDCIERLESEAELYDAADTEEQQ